VARSEDQQLPPRDEPAGTARQAWPLARAVWPTTGADGDAEGQLPNRRLAPSG
jgi:hypothetical protein